MVLTNLSGWSGVWVSKSNIVDIGHISVTVFGIVQVCMGWLNWEGDGRHAELENPNAYLK